MPQQSQSLVNPQLAEHLAGFAAKGTSLENAKTALKTAGWSDEEIAAALAEHPFEQPIINPSALGQNSFSATMPAFSAPTETPQSSRITTISLILSLILLATFIVYALVHYYSTPATQTSGTINTSDCIKENGLLTGATNKICQIGSVQLTIID